MATDAPELVVGFYEAALDATLFPERLQELAEFARGVGAGLLLWDKRLGTPDLLVTSGHMGADAFESYKRTYAALDPYRSLVESRPLGEWTAGNNGDGGFARDTFFNEYLTPRGIENMAAARISAGERMDVILWIHRGSGCPAFSKNELAEFGRVSRHLERPIKLYFDRATMCPVRTAALTVLEQASSPAALIDETCSVLFASPIAEALFKTQDAVGVRDGRLVAHRDGDESRLKDLVAKATHEQPPSGGEMLLARPLGRPPLALFVMPAGLTTTSHSLAAVPAALVMFRDPTRLAPNLARRLEGLFNLSKMETALVLGLIEGRRLTEIAASRRISVETVRTQLRSIFRKTGVSRQTDLIRMLQVLLQPLSG